VTCACPSGDLRGPHIDDGSPRPTFNFRVDQLELAGRCGHERIEHGGKGFRAAPRRLYCWVTVARSCSDWLPISASAGGAILPSRPAGAYLTADVTFVTQADVCSVSYRNPKPFSGDALESTECRAC